MASHGTNVLNRSKDLCEVTSQEPALTLILASILSAGNVIDVYQLARWEKELIRCGFLARDEYMDGTGEFHWDIVLTRSGYAYLTRTIALAMERELVVLKASTAILAAVFVSGNVIESRQLMTWIKVLADDGFLGRLDYIDSQKNELHVDRALTRNGVAVLGNSLGQLVKALNNNFGV